MSVAARMAGIPEGGLGDKRLIQALSMGKDNMQELVAIANGAPPKNGIDSMYATMALNILGPALKAQKAQQAQQQPKQPSVKDQVVADAADTGIAALPAENVMTEKAMAAGGIVAFEEGGRVPRYNGEFGSFVMPPRTDPMYDQVIEGFRQAVPGIIAKQRRGEKLAPNEQQVLSVLKDTGMLPFPYSIGMAESAAPARPVSAAQQAPAPTAAAQQPPAGAGPEVPPAADKQQTPGGLPSAKLPAYPSFAPRYEKAASEYETAAGQLESPLTAAKRVLTSPEYAGILGPSEQDIRASFSPQLGTARKMYSQSEEEALAKIQQREAGLGALREEQRKLLGETKEEAEQSASRGRGEALMQLASTLVSTPINNPNFQKGMATFTSTLKDVRKDLDGARKEYRTGLAKLAEAQELQRIGQFEKASAEFREGQKLVMDVEGKLSSALLAGQASRTQAAVSLGGTEAQRALDSLNKKTQFTLQGIASDQQRADTVFKGEVDIKQYELLAGARAGAANRFTYEEARTKARTEMPFDAFQTKWVTSGESKRTGRPLPTQEDYDRALDALARSILARNEAYYSGTTAAPSGGGAALDPNQFTVREKK